MAELILTLKNQIVKRMTLTKDETTIGRDIVNDFCIDNPGVSRFQARIVHYERKYFLLDEGSSNGTFVNGKRVSQLELEDGTEIQFAKYKLIFSAHTSGADADSPNALPNFLASTESTLLYSDNDLKKMIDDESARMGANIPMAGFSHEQQHLSPIAAPKKAAAKKSNTILYVIIAIALFALGFSAILFLI